MHDNIIQARIKRNRLAILAGEHYRDAHSAIVKEFTHNGLKIYAGIQQGNGMYTLLGKSAVHYASKHGHEGSISYNVFLEILAKNAMEKGKKGTFDFVLMPENDAVWVMNIETMNALWNTMLLLRNANNNGSVSE